MLRAILKHQERDGISGAEGEYFETIDFECKELQDRLVGGIFETGYHIINVIGVEVLPEAKTDVCQHHWLAALSPNGGYEATCRHCGERKHVNNA